MSSDKCECGFYDRDRHHTKIGGGECDFMAYRKRIAELEAEEQLFNKTFDAQQMIIEELRAENQRLRNSLADIALKLAGMLRGVK